MADLTAKNKLQQPAIAAQLWSAAQHGDAWAAAAGGKGGKGGELPVAPVGREAEAFGDHTMFVAAHTLALLQEHYELSHNDMHPGNLLLHATAQVHFGAAATARGGGGGDDASASFVRGCGSLAEHHEESPPAAAAAAAAAASASATAVQKAPLGQQPWLFYRWGDHLFRLPTPTCTCKVIDFGLSSMRVSGVRRWLSPLSYM